MALVLWALITILRVVGTLAFFRFLVLVAMLVLGFALLVFCHKSLRLVDFIRGAPVSTLLFAAFPGAVKIARLRMKFCVTA